MKITETKRISNVYQYLKGTKADEVIVRSSLVSGGWYEVESDAESAGFKVARFLNPEYLARHEFAECYDFYRN